MPFAISKKSWLGVAREATPGTAITTPTMYVPTKSTLKNKRKQEFLNEERGTRDSDYDVVDTIRNATWDIKGPFYPDSYTYFLIGAMGDVSSAQQGSTAAYKHSLIMNDVPSSLTLMKSYHSHVYYSPYCTVSKWSLKFSSADKLLECDASGEGIWMVEKTTPPIPAFSTVKPFPGYALSLSLTGGATTDIEELEITFTQKWKLFYPASGVPDFAAAYPGERTVDFKYTARFDTDTIYQYYLRGNNDTLTLDVQGSQIAAPYNYELNIVLPVTHYTDMEHDLGKENVLIKASGKSIMAGSAALMEAFVINSTSSYTV
jgi:hypothetical protein